MQKLFSFIHIVEQCTIHLGVLEPLLSPFEERCVGSRALPVSSLCAAAGTRCLFLEQDPTSEQRSSLRSWRGLVTPFTLEQGEAGFPFLPLFPSRPKAQRRND